MKNGEWIIRSIDDLKSVIDEMVVLKSSCAIFTLSGPLGAGKTTICQQFLKACGITEQVTSPTFTYLNVYKNKEAEYYYHFDLYRLSSIANFLDAGFDEYLYRNNSWCLIEWPELIQPLLKKKICAIAIDYHSEGRKISFDIYA